MRERFIDAGRASLNPLIVTYLAFSTVVPVGFMWLNDSDGTITPLIWCLGITLGSLALYEWQREGHPLTPAGILALGGILIFVLRPITVRSLDFTTAGANADGQPYEGDIIHASNLSLEQLTFFYAVFGIVYFLIIDARGRREPVPAWEVTDQHVKRAGQLLLGALGLAALASFELIQSSGGLAAHLAGVSVRSSFLAGRYYLTLGYVPLAVCLVMYLLVRRRHPTKPTLSPFPFVAMFALFGSAFVTGGRGPLLLGAIVPLLLVVQLGPKRLKTIPIIVLGVALIVGAELMSLLLRDNKYDNGEALVELSSNPVTTLLTRLTSGTETRPFDSLILLNEMHIQGKLHFQGGWTYLTVPEWFIPSSLLPSKEGGGNAWFTRTFMPRFYYPDHIETSVSAIGEAFMNFGWFGIPFVAAAVAAAAASFSRIDRSSTLTRATLYVMLTPLFFSYVRGDAYQNLSLAGFIVVIVLLSRWWIFVGAKKPDVTSSRVQPSNRIIVPQA